MKDLVILKLGGSIITYKKSKTPRANKTNIERISREIASVYLAKKPPMIIVHGAGSYGHRIVKESGINRGIKSESQLKDFAKTQWLQNKLNCLVTQFLIKQGIPAFPCQVSSFAVMKSEKLIKMDVSAIFGMVSIGMVPILYGVPAFDQTQKCSILSGDEIAPYLAVKLDAKRIIYATNVDGVFTSDPNKDKNAKLISEINSENIEDVKKSLADSTANDVTGEMYRKVCESLGIGIESQIISGLTEGNIARALNGESFGTIIKP
jgi:isopentenyl phosphate kinase